MDMTQRVVLAQGLVAVEVELQAAMMVLAQCLVAVEVELQAAVAGLDGSPASRTRLAQAQAVYREAETQALEVISALALARDTRASHPPAAA